MRFNLVINMERYSSEQDMRDISRHTTEMVQMADQGGFDIVWAAEHHALEMTISPGPFQLMAHWAAHTSQIRIGCACVVAPYWHPIKLAGEAALFDLLSGGRLEFGIGKGAYQREFDRLMNGMDQNLGVPMMLEMIPALKELWRGDYAHDGKYWQFPESTSCPKPLQTPHPPIWVAARDPGTYDAAVSEGYNIMSWALTRPFSETKTYMERFESALKKAPKGTKRPYFMTMRHVGIFDTIRDSDIFIESIQKQGRQFENLFRKLKPVKNGFPIEPNPVDLINQDEYQRKNLMDNLILGTPDEAILKLKPYENLGVDYFCYMASYHLPLKEQKKSLKLFIDEVLPEFQKPEPTRLMAE